MAWLQSQTPRCLCSAGGRGQQPALLSEAGELVFTLPIQQMQLHNSQRVAHGYSLKKKKRISFKIQHLFFFFFKLY